MLCATWVLCDAFRRDQIYRVKNMILANFIRSHTFDERHKHQSTSLKARLNSFNDTWLCNKFASHLPKCISHLQRKFKRKTNAKQSKPKLKQQQSALLYAIILLWSTRFTWYSCWIYYNNLSSHYGRWLVPCCEWRAFHIRVEQRDREQKPHESHMIIMPTTLNLD